MLIGLHGLKQSGKDTLCQILVEWYESLGYDAERRAFGTKVKAAATRSLGLQLTDDEAEEWFESFKLYGEIRYGALGHVEPGKISGREFLQHYTAYREVFGEDVWVDLCLPQHELELPDSTLVVVTDVRFSNEAQRIHDLGGEIWNIVRPDAESDGHESESGIDNKYIDCVIVNDGTIEDLRDKAIGLLR